MAISLAVKASTESTRTSNIAEMFGFEEAEFGDLDTDLDDAIDLDDDLDEEPDEALNTLLDGDLDDDLEDLGDEELAPVPTAKNQVKSSSKAQSKTQSKAQTQGKASKSNGRDFRYRDPIEEASRLSASAAVNGRETNGVNVAGLAGQLVTLGIVVGQGVLENLAAQDDEERIERIVRELQRQNEQVDHLASRLQEATTGRSTVTPSAETEPVADENPLADAAATVGSKVCTLGAKLDPTYKGQPLEIDREASISEQLDQIEAYLKGLSKRLDRLEIAVSRLEKQIAGHSRGVNPYREQSTMTTNQISATMTQADRDAVLAAVATIKEKLPFLIDLTPEQRKSLPKMGDKSQAFVNKALEVATQNPDFLPRSFDLEEMKRDVELFQALYPVFLSLTQLQELVDDTVIAVGSDAYAAALVVYNFAKASGKGSGLDAVADEMGKRFARKSRKVQPEGATV